MLEDASDTQLNQNLVQK